jgi:hypothetical protein
MSKQFFPPSEFKHYERMNKAFLARVEEFRRITGYPMLITSDWRDHPTSAHGKGEALDLVVYRKWREQQPHWFDIYTQAVHFGFSGVGIYFDWTAFGKKVIGLHVDDLADPTKRPLQWVRTNNTRYYYNRRGTFINSADNSILTIADIDAIARHY